MKLTALQTSLLQAIAAGANTRSQLLDSTGLTAMPTRSLESLWDKGLVRVERLRENAGFQSWHLTGEGWRVARSLRVEEGGKTP